MSPYRPVSGAPLTLDGGYWATSGRPIYKATVTLDPRLLTWLVNLAAKRTSLRYIVQQGTPPLNIQLS